MSWNIIHDFTSNAARMVILMCKSRIKGATLPRVLACLLVCLLVCSSMAGCAGEGDATRNGDGAVQATQQRDAGETASQDTSAAEADADDTTDASSVAASDWRDGAVQAMPLEAKALMAPDTGKQRASSVAVARGANDFAFRLSASLAEGAGDGNLVCSPYSVWMPLAALANATDEQHKAGLMAALSASGISEADLNAAASRMLYDLTRQANKQYEADYGIAYHDPLKIANAVFVDNDVSLKQSFAQAFLDYYRGSAMNVDFSSSEAVDAVNAWASENTDGMISDIIKEFDPLTVAAIANAIYFSDRWEWEFDASMTREDVFHSPAGDVAASFMLREGDNQAYYEDERIQAMPLRFSTGGCLYILLPKDGDATGLLASMTSGYFEEIQAGAEYVSGKLLLPRFSIESEAIELGDTLTALGVPLFDRDSAPLTGGLIEENTKVWLSSAVHKAVIKVDEKGTTAAAVTVMIAAGSGMPVPTEPFEMVCDAPFVFVLCGHTYDGGNQVLFTGIVNQP